MPIVFAHNLDTVPEGSAKRSSLTLRPALLKAARRRSFLLPISDFEFKFNDTGASMLVLGFGGSLESAVLARFRETKNEAKRAKRERERVRVGVCGFANSSAVGYLLVHIMSVIYLF